MGWFIPNEKMSTQQKLVLEGIFKKKNKTNWIQGFAGTGKTVLLVNLMKNISVTDTNASMCFITYTNALKDLVASGLDNSVEIYTHTKFIANKKKYDYVFLDEVQDITTNDIYEIGKFSGVLHIAGDPDQNIYGDRASVSELQEILQPQKWILKEIFRLTKLLKDVAMSIMPNANLIEGNEAMQKAQAQIRLFHCQDHETECYEMYMRAKKGARPDNPSVILFPGHTELLNFGSTLARKLVGDTPPNVNPKIKPYYDNPKSPTYGDFNDWWEENELPISFFGNGWGSFAESELKPIVYLMTMHSSKGLDFKTVCIPSLNSDTNLVSQKVLENDPSLERRLLFVAITRSRKDLYLSHTTTKPHPLLHNLPISVTKKYISKTTDEDSDSEDSL